MLNMMKTFFSLLIIIFAVHLNFAQNNTSQISQNAELKEVNQLNAKMLELYKQSKYDEALEIARQVLVLREKAVGEKHADVAAAHFNLGAIYLGKNKAKDSVSEFEQALVIYRETLGETNAKVFSTMNMLSASLFLKDNRGEALTMLKNALTIGEKVFGAESKEVAEQNLKIANSLANMMKYDGAEKYYLKAIEINDKLAANKSAKNDESKLEDRDDLDKYTCFVQMVDLKKASEKLKALDEKRKLFLKNDKEFESASIINGKALKLIKPPYPDKAKEQGFHGAVTIRVLIDETGNVIDAKSTCGDTILGLASREAALKSKFSPTTVNGKFVRVTGIIIYNFTRN